MPVRQDVLSQPTARLVAALRGSRLSIATAESCTGGQLAALLAADTALGPHLERGFIVYSTDAKCELLGVDRAAAERCKAVNSEVAEAMATGALARSRADIAVSVTGFCGPQEADEEVGLVHLACAATGAPPVLQECHFGDIGRQRVLDHAVAAALTLLVHAVAESSDPAQRLAAGTTPG